jgi:hypothetical protein
MKTIWIALLRLYPKAYRETFAAEMEAVFDQAVEEWHRHGRFAFAGFVVAEWFGALRGAGAAWFAARPRMPLIIGLPDDTSKTETLIQANLRRMEDAIATHQFERARFFSYMDIELRRHLNRLQGA